MSPRPDEADRRPKIAVVGSGLAGLAATWLMGRHARVTVYEAHPTPGMGAHSVRLGKRGDDPLIDIPLRVFTRAYYPTLLWLYEQAGVDVAPVDYAASFSWLRGRTYFRYRNVRVGGRSLPWVAPTALLDAESRTIVWELLRLHRQGAADLRAGRLRGRSVGSYLSSEGYDPIFVEGFLLPAYATLCTCTHESVRAYPADLIVDYICSGVTTLGVARAVRGSENVIARLMTRATEVKTGTPVRRILPGNDAVRVIDAEGRERRYDHVILAAPADRGAALIDGDTRLREVLTRVPHERSRIVVHSDPRLAPRGGARWSPVNVMVSSDYDAPMATIWLNRVQNELERAPPIFQTWNPIIEPAPDRVIAEVQVARPVVTVPTRDVPERLTALMDDPGRRIWPVGSYAEEGIPLLEGAAASAVRIARRLLEDSGLHEARPSLGAGNGVSRAR